MWWTSSIVVVSTKQLGQLAIDMSRRIFQFVLELDNWSYNIRRLMFPSLSHNVLADRIVTLQSPKVLFTMAGHHPWKPEKNKCRYFILQSFSNRRTREWFTHFELCTFDILSYLVENYHIHLFDLIPLKPQPVLWHICIFALHGKRTNYIQINHFANRRRRDNDRHIPVTELYLYLCLSERN